MIISRRTLLRNLGGGAAASVGLSLLSGRAFAMSIEDTPNHRFQMVPPRGPLLKAQPPYRHSERKWKDRQAKSKHKHAKPRFKARSLRAQYTFDTPGNRRDLALTIWGEARGYGTNGMRAVGHVIMNRVKLNKQRFGLGVSGVCRKKGKKVHQFSCWNKGDANEVAMKNLPIMDENNPDWIAFMKADKIAGEILAGISKDITGGATFYFAESMPHKPYWIDDMTIIGVMYGHMFCKEKPRSARKRNRHSRHHTHDSHHTRKAKHHYDHNHASHHR